MLCCTIYSDILSSDMDDLAMTCSDFVNALNILMCSEKHPVSRDNYSYAKKVVIERWATM